MLNLYVYIYIKYKFTVRLYLIANQTDDLVFASTIEQYCIFKTNILIYTSVFIYTQKYN